jgi:DNA-binding CsgD family transcriptional regulator
VIYFRACPRCRGAVEFQCDDPFTESLVCLACGWRVDKVDPVYNGRVREPDPHRFASASRSRNVNARAREAYAWLGQGLRTREIAILMKAPNRSVARWLSDARRAMLEERAHGPAAPPFQDRATT